MTINKCSQSSKLSFSNEHNYTTLLSTEEINSSQTNKYVPDDILLFNTIENQETSLNVKTKEGVKVHSQIYKNTRFIVLSDSESVVLSEDQLEEVISKVKQTNQAVAHPLTTERESLG